MLWYERRKMSPLLGGRPYVSFFLSNSEKASVWVLGDNRIIENFVTKGGRGSFDIELAQGVKFIVIIRETRSRKIAHVFQIVEHNVGEVARCSVAGLRQWLSQNLGFVPSI